MKMSIEIVGNTVTCRQDGEAALTAALPDFLGNLKAASDHSPSPEPIPDTVRFFWQRGDAVVLAMEQRPACHTVRWLSDDSRVPFGQGAKYGDFRIAFPFVWLIVAFHGVNLTGQQQCFYRRSPLVSIEDELLLPNLLNVATAYGQTCWLCLANLNPNMAQLSWAERVRRIWTHVFQAGFNTSSEHHEGNSYWQTMRMVDPRVASVAAWQEESARDPFFPLTVEWKTSGRTLRSVMKETMDRVWPLLDPASAADLLPFFSPPAKRAVGRRFWWK